MSLLVIKWDYEFLKKLNKISQHSNHAGTSGGEIHFIPAASQIEGQDLMSIRQQLIETIGNEVTIEKENVE